MLAKAGRSGYPIPTPSVCLYMVLLKLNSTEDVALFINSTNTCFGMTGWELDWSQRASEQILMVSSRGTLVNKLDTSKEHTKTLGSMSRFCIVLGNVNESDM